MILQNITVIGSDISSRDVHLHQLMPQTTLDGSDAILFPGLVNAHDHLELNVFPQLGRPPYRDYIEWSRDVQEKDAAIIREYVQIPFDERLAWGIIKNVMCGVTRVWQHGPLGGLGENVGDLIDVSTGGRVFHSLAFEARWRRKLLAPGATQPIIIHLAEGISRRAQREARTLVRWNLLKRPLIAVHGISLKPELANRFQAVIWCPVANHFLYDSTAPAAELKNHTTIRLGTDSTLTATWNVWDHLRFARQSGHLSDLELFQAVTPPLANTTPHSGDWVVAARQGIPQPWEAFFATNPEHILMMVRRNQIVMIDDAWLDKVELNPDGNWYRIELASRCKWLKLPPVLHPLLPSVLSPAIFQH